MDAFVEVGDVCFFLVFVRFSDDDFVLRGWQQVCLFGLEDLVVLGLFVRVELLVRESHLVDAFRSADMAVVLLARPFVEDGRLFAF